ncbi:hypothetical protein ACIGO9_26775 [Nocardia asteroides]|uniref:hypothetical protein n=1 Tax=Nocardia asteroides TaxID=1824 RepID=UPI0037C6A786
MIAFGFAVAIGLPLFVLFAVLVWPERIPPDRTVHGIQQRIESERKRQRGRRTSNRPPW